MMLSPCLSSIFYELTLGFDFISCSIFSALITVPAGTDHDSDAQDLKIDCQN